MSEHLQKTQFSFAYANELPPGAFEALDPLYLSLVTGASSGGMAVLRLSKQKRGTQVYKAISQWNDECDAGDRVTLRTLPGQSRDLLVEHTNEISTAVRQAEARGTAGYRQYNYEAKAWSPVVQAATGHVRPTPGSKRVAEPAPESARLAKRAQPSEDPRLKDPWVAKGPERQARISTPPEQLPPFEWDPERYAGRPYPGMPAVLDLPKLVYDANLVHYRRDETGRRSFVDCRDGEREIETVKDARMIADYPRFKPEYDEDGLWIYRPSSPRFDHGGREVLNVPTPRYDAEGKFVPVMTSPQSVGGSFEVCRSPPRFSSRIVRCNVLVTACDAMRLKIPDVVYRAAEAHRAADHDLPVFVCEPDCVRAR